MLDKECVECCVHTSLEVTWHETKGGFIGKRPREQRHEERRNEMRKRNESLGGIIHSEVHNYTVEKAHEVAEELQRYDEMEWTYTVDLLTEGMARVRITDEDGFFVANW